MSRRHLLLLSCGLVAALSACSHDHHAPKPTLSLSADRASATAGSDIKLTWTSADAASCTASGGWSGLQATSGSATVTPKAKGTATYTLDCSGAGGDVIASASVAVGAKVIVFVWDGLRPDSVSAANTPNLARLRDTLGVNFQDNHSVFPTFTMMNASAFATGSYPGTHGFFGNTEYQPGPTGKTATGGVADFSQPIFTEDWAVLTDLDSYYKANNSALFLVDTLFQTAHKAGFKTAAVGKSGADFIQDYDEVDTGIAGANGVILDENFAYPLAFAQALQTAGIAIPKNSPFAYDAGALTLAAANGDPTATINNVVLLADGRTSDPRSTRGSAHNAKNEYLMGVYTRYILPTVRPDLSLIWFRNPDSTEHTFGPGTAAYADALRDQDELLGQLIGKIAELGLSQGVDLIIANDHGHTTVAGDPAIFPLRGLTGAADGSGAVDLAGVDPKGYSVSGDVRTADLLARAGFAHVYDGNGCTYDPVLSGILANGSPLYPTQLDTGASNCGGTASAPVKFNTGNFRLPATLPSDAIVIAANGGSDYFYVPDATAAVTLVPQIVKALQARPQYGAVFVRSAFGSIDGTLPLSMIKVEGAGRGSPPTPDIIASFNFDADAVTAGNIGVPGTEYESAQNNRGMHGSFGPRDVHNSLFAAGPDFKSGFVDTLPTGNVDVAPTVAAILGLSMPKADGRVLTEALAGQTVSYTVTPLTVTPPNPAALNGFCRPDDVSCTTPSVAGTYSYTLAEKSLDVGGGKTYLYFDSASAQRQ